MEGSICIGEVKIENDGQKTKTLNTKLITSTNYAHMSQQNAQHSEIDGNSLILLIDHRKVKVDG